MRRSACVLAALLFVGGIVGATGARAANELAVAAGRDGDPALNAVYAARGFAPLWTGSMAAEKRRETLLALLRAETGGDPATASGAALEVGATRQSGDIARRDRRHRAPRSPISRDAPAATPSRHRRCSRRCSGSTGRSRRPRWHWRCSSSRSSRTWVAGGGSAPCPGRCRPCHPRRWPAPRSTWPRACRRARPCPSRSRCGSVWCSRPTCRRASLADRRWTTS